MPAGVGVFKAHNHLGHSCITTFRRAALPCLGQQNVAGPTMSAGRVSDIVDETPGQRLPCASGRCLATQHGNCAHEHPWMFSSTVFCQVCGMPAGCVGVHTRCLEYARCAMLSLEYKHTCVATGPVSAATVVTVAALLGHRLRARMHAPSAKRNTAGRPCSPSGRWSWWDVIVLVMCVLCVCVCYHYC